MIKTKFVYVHFKSQSKEDSRKDRNQYLSVVRSTTYSHCSPICGFVNPSKHTPNMQQIGMK